MEPKRYPKMNFRLSEEDLALLEPLRIKLGLRSHAAVLRKLLRDAAKERLG